MESQLPAHIPLELQQQQQQQQQQHQQQHSYQGNGYQRHPNPRHCARARASPPPDPELGRANEYNGYNGYNGRDAAPPELTAAAMKPPRLQQPGCCNKLVVLAACCTCFVICTACAFAFFSLPIVASATAALQERMRPAPVPPSKRPLPAVLHRYGMIKRAAAPARGADPVALRTAFPHWHTDDGALQFEAVVSDLALGLAAVAEQLDPKQELRIISSFPSPPLPPPPLELPTNIGQSEEETEL